MRKSHETRGIYDILKVPGSLNLQIINNSSLITPKPSSKYPIGQHVSPYRLPNLHRIDLSR